VQFAPPEDNANYTETCGDNTTVTIYVKLTCNCCKINAYPFTTFSNLKNTMSFIRIVLRVSSCISLWKETFICQVYSTLSNINVTTAHSNTFYRCGLLSYAECSGFWCCSLRSSALQTIQCNYSWSRVIAVREGTKRQFPTFIIRDMCTSRKCALHCLSLPLFNTTGFPLHVI
jgi:hypothetical protein